jgi:hypothetical protein
MHDPNQEADILAVRAQTLAEGPDPAWAEILADLDRAAELYRGLGLRPRLVRVLVQRGRALDALGRAAEADASRADAAEIGGNIVQTASPSVGANH